MVLVTTFTILKGVCMMQVQYPSDYVGADGKWYPTVGEAFRRGSGVSSLLNIAKVLSEYYSDIVVDILTVTTDAEGTVTYESSLGYTYSIERSSIIISPDYENLSIIDRLLISGKPTKTSLAFLYSNRGGYFKNGKTYLSGDKTPENSVYKFAVIIGVTR